MCWVQFLIDFWFSLAQRPNPKREPPGGPHLGSTLLLYEGTGATRPPPFLSPRHRFSQTQATAVWNWANFLHDRIPPHERALVVNMDETSIRLYQKPGKGYVVMMARNQKRSAKSLTRSVTKGQLLGTFTHVAMICDDAELQPHLPQFLFINQTQISQAEFESIQTR